MNQLSEMNSDEEMKRLTMREHDPIQNDVRQRTWKRKFGPKPVCVLCRFDRPEGLRMVPWSIIEAHHSPGRAIDPRAKVPLCKNCHAVVTELNRKHGASMDPPANIFEHVVGVLRALGVFFPLVGQSFFKLADQLVEFISALDSRYPDWRSIKEAK